MSIKITFFHLLGGFTLTTDCVTPSAVVSDLSAIITASGACHSQHQIFFYKCETIKVKCSATEHLLVLIIWFKVKKVQTSYVWQRLKEEMKWNENYGKGHSLLSFRHRQVGKSCWFLLMEGLAGGSQTFSFHFFHNHFWDDWQQKSTSERSYVPIHKCMPCDKYTKEFSQNGVDGREKEKSQIGYPALGHPTVMTT